MKIALGIIVVFICVFIGYQMSLKYVKRKAYYVAFENFNQDLIREMSFTMQTIEKVIDALRQKKDEFSKITVSFFDDNKKIESKILREDEKEDLKAYLNSVGKSDAKSQLKLLEGYKIKICDNVKIATLEEKKYKSFYIKLGFLFGLIIFIILL